jgi:hypothetical protein
MMGLTPLVLAGLPNLASATSPTLKNLPSDIESGMRQRAKNSGLGTPDEDTVIKICDRLWAIYEIAVGKAATIEPTVYAVCMEKSGQAVVDKFRLWSDVAEQDLTIVCAARCAFYSRELAQNGKVTDVVYREAWNRTKWDQDNLLKRVGGAEGLAC